MMRSTIYVPYRTQARSIAQATGCKGYYALMELKYHNPLFQTVPDAMHTVKDVIEHLFYLIIGKEDSIKVRRAEEELQRFSFSGTPIAPTHGEKVHESAPFCITKQQIKLADQRACGIICPQHIDFVPRAFFSKTHFKSHDWKQVCTELHALFY